MNKRIIYYLPEKKTKIIEKLTSFCEDLEIARLRNQKFIGPRFCIDLERKECWLCSQWTIKLPSWSHFREDNEESVLVWHTNEIPKNLDELKRDLVWLAISAP